MTRCANNGHPYVRSTPCDRNRPRTHIFNLLGLFGLSLLSACAPTAFGAASEPGRAPGFGTLRLDANPEKTFVVIYDDKGRQFAGGARLNKHVVVNEHGGSRAIPRWIRATWRTGRPYLTSEGTWTGGTVMGEYTATVADRIPPEVFDYVRQHGGSLRLKLRVVDGAVLVAWDVEKYVSAEGWKPGDGDSGFHYHMVGGDFREDKVFNGKIVEPGWERVPPTASGTR